ncbi:MAG: TIGR03943 family protein [Candidatus Gracilibacteria bacterium]|nr:TIGR03943 family protein [Candidatus Gracilibacteria bacterium]
MTRFLDFIALLGLALLTSFLSGTDQIGLLINPRYEILVSFGSACLIMGALWTLFRGKSIRRDRSHVTSAILILFVLVFSTQIPLRSLSSETALNRGVESRVPTIDELKFTEALNTPSKERTLTEWVRILTQHPDPRIFFGQKVVLEGMVAKLPSLPENTLMLSRFVVACCIADARPLALLVTVPNTEEWENSDWIRVSGTIESGEFEGKQRGFVSAENIQIIDEPKNPYEYEY